MLSYTVHQIWQSCREGYEKDCEGGGRERKENGIRMEMDGRGRIGWGGEIEGVVIWTVRGGGERKERSVYNALYVRLYNRKTGKH